MCVYIYLFIYLFIFFLAFTRDILKSSTSTKKDPSKKEFPTGVLWIHNMIYLLP